MSVLIKGMEKPKNCIWRDGKCPLLGDDDDCKLQDCQEEWTWQDQYKGCPLSDVPDTNVGGIISRQAAYDALMEEPLKWDDSSVWESARCHQWMMDMDVIKALPSAQPERKTGKWIEYDGDWLKTMCKCSECGAMIDINEKYRNFFCYHCGARMDGEADD